MHTRPEDSSDAVDKSIFLFGKKSWCGGIFNPYFFIHLARPGTQAGPSLGTWYPAQVGLGPGSNNCRAGLWVVPCSPIDLTARDLSGGGPESHFSLFKNKIWAGPPSGTWYPARLGLGLGSKNYHAGFGPPARPNN